MEDATPLTEAWIRDTVPPPAGDMPTRLLWELGPPGETQGLMNVMYSPTTGVWVNYRPHGAIKTRGDLRHLWRTLTGVLPVW